MISIEGARAGYAALRDALAPVAMPARPAQPFTADGPAEGLMGGPTGGPAGAAAVAEAARSFAGTLQAGERTALAAVAGQAEPAALVTALAQTQLAVEAAVTVRDRVVEAYQEILRMQV